MGIVLALRIRQKSTQQRASHEVLKNKRNTSQKSFATITSQMHVLKGRIPHKRLDGHRNLNHAKAQRRAAGDPDHEVKEEALPPYWGS